VLGAQSRSSDKDSKYRHLADPGQKDVFFSRGEAAILCLGAKRMVRCDCAVGFLSAGGGLVADPHQSPFWIKALGLSPLVGTDTRPLAARSPRNASVPRHVQVLRSAAERRSGFTDRWLFPSGEVQHFARFMTGAHQPPSVAPRRQCRDAAAPNHVRWLLANTPVS